MKKIGILTFHRAVNYGAILQAYALAMCLCELGYDAEIVDYRNKKIEDTYYSVFGAIPHDKVLITMRNIIRNVLSYHVQRKRNIKFRTFVKERCKVSKTIYTKKTIDQANKIYDIFLVGSDQVWNLPCTDGDKTYFLDFVWKCKSKYSFAASFGKLDNIEKNYDRIFPLLNDFISISVREVVGKDLIQSNTREIARVDIDPVFLLSHQKWRALEVKPDISNYILVYSVNLPSSVIDYARDIAKTLNKQLLLITLRNNKARLNDNELDKSCCSPEEFLGLIDYADLVITNSFHGTAFSIIFHSNFIVVRNSQLSSGMDNSRLDNILKSLDLISRVSDYANPEESIDFNHVETKLNLLREYSMEYLQSLK